MLSCEVHTYIKLDTFDVYDIRILFCFSCFCFNKHLFKCVVNCVSSDYTTKCIESLTTHTHTLFLHTQTVHVFSFSYFSLI